MKKIILSLLLLSTGLVYCLAQSAKKNIRVEIQVEPYINEVEQMAYTWHYEDNECIIDDSAKIVPEHDVYKLRSSLPCEGTVCLSFSKRGPAQLEILAHPHDRIKISIGQEDDNIATSHKKLINGSALNDSYVAFCDTTNFYRTRILNLENDMAVYGTPQERIKQLADSIASYEKKDIEFLIYTAAHTPSPYIANLAHIFLWKKISNEQFLAIQQANYRRFPDYPTFQRVHSHKKLPPESEASKRNSRFFFQLKHYRVIFRQEELKADTLTTGNSLNVSLVDSTGQAISLSAFKGKYVLLEIWASWCLPCIKAMPNIIKAQQIYNDDFVCLAISIDKYAAPWKRSIERYSLQKLHHFKATDSQGNMYEDMKPLAAGGAIPRNYLLDREGRIIATDLYDEELIKKLEELTVEQK